MEINRVSSIGNRNFKSNINRPNAITTPIKEVSISMPITGSYDFAVLGITEKIKSCLNDVITSKIQKGYKFGNGIVTESNIENIATSIQRITSQKTMQESDPVKYLGKHYAEDFKEPTSIAYHAVKDNARYETQIYFDRNIAYRVETNMDTRKQTLYIANLPSVNMTQEYVNQQLQKAGMIYEANITGN